MTIDVHVHRYPHEVFADPVAFAVAKGEKHWRELVAPTKGNSLQGWADRETMLADMDAAGVDQAVLLGWYWEQPETCALQNRWHAEWIVRDPDRFYAFAAIHPHSPTLSGDLAAARDSGFRGIGESHPAVQGSTLRDPAWKTIAAFAVAQDWPLLLHVTEPVGRPHPGRVHTPFEDLLWFASEHPSLKLVLAHWGGGLPFYELNPYVRKRLRNVYYDVAASPLLYDKAIFRTVLDLVGPDKILYGSDYPLRLHPARSEKPAFAVFLEEIRSAGLSESEEKKILGDNTARLLGLDLTG